MPDSEKVIKELEGLRDICNAKSNMAIGKGKIAWAGHANAVDDAFTLLKEQEAKTKHCNDIALEYAKEVFRLQTLLKEQPEIVQCKDCKHIEHMYTLDELNGKKCYVCRKHSFTGQRDEDWFCADGERR